MSILYKISHYSDNVTGDRENNLRIQLLSRETLNKEDFVDFLVKRGGGSKGDMYKAVTVVLEGIEKVLREGDIVKFEGFGSFSLNGTFRKDKERSENHRSESVEVKNVVFKADKKLKSRIDEAGFEKYNPAKHPTRKY